MLISLLRHGAAEQKKDGPDEDRQLTRAGILETRAVIGKLKMYAPAFDLIWVSPYQRARQTASALRIAIPDVSFEINKQITPNDDVYELMDAIEKCGVHQLLIVSHNPLLSNLLRIMVDGTMESDRNMSTSELVSISMDFVAPGCGEVLFSLKP